MKSSLVPLCMRYIRRGKGHGSYTIFECPKAREEASDFGCGGLRSFFFGWGGVGQAQPTSSARFKRWNFQLGLHFGRGGAKARQG